MANAASSVPKLAMRPMANRGTGCTFTIPNTTDEFGRVLPFHEWDDTIAQTHLLVSISNFATYDLTTCSNDIPKMHRQWLASGAGEQSMQKRPLPYFRNRCH